METKPLKKFISIHEVTVQDILDVLDRWEKGQIESSDVLLFAERLDDQGLPDYARQDPRSIWLMVIEALATLHVQPILKSDIPALKRCLGLSVHSPLEAWEFIDTYWQGIDWGKRVNDLYQN
jgi:hypothetical protein